MIEAVDGRFVRVVLRPFPKLFVISSALPWTPPVARPLEGDHCRLYYNQPRSLPGFLALKYIVSGRAGTVATFRRVLETLDEIARIKGTDAIVCDAMNWKLSDRLMVRGGWESHCPSRWHRHFIKRFYGSYPSPRGGSRRWRSRRCEDGDSVDAGRARPLRGLSIPNPNPPIPSLELVLLPLGCPATIPPPFSVGREVPGRAFGRGISGVYCHVTDRMDAVAARTVAGRVHGVPRRSDGPQRAGSNPSAATDRASASEQGDPGSSYGPGSRQPGIGGIASPGQAEKPDSAG